MLVYAYCPIYIIKGHPCVKYLPTGYSFIPEVREMPLIKYF